MCKKGVRLFTPSLVTTNDLQILVTYKNGTEKLVEPRTKLDLINDNISKLNIPEYDNEEDKRLSEIQILDTVIDKEEDWKPSDLHGMYHFLDYEISPRIQIIETYHICPEEMPTEFRS